MKPLLFGAVLGLLWLLLGLPLAAPFVGVANLVQPVTVAFATGVLAAPHVRRWGWSR